MDAVTQFYQGPVSPSGTIVVTQAPFGQQYTVRNIQITNNNQFNNICITGYIGIGSTNNNTNIINNNQTFVTSGTLVLNSGFYQTTDMWVLNAGQSMMLVLASGTSGVSASVHGVISS